MLLCKCVPVLTLAVLHIAEDPNYVGRLTTLAKSGYFSAVLFFYPEIGRSGLLLLRKYIAKLQLDTCAYETSSTFATCLVQASCGSTVRGLLTRSITDAML